jgi:type IV secretory pathway VirJ component
MRERAARNDIEVVASSIANNISRGYTVEDALAKAAKVFNFMSPENIDIAASMANTYLAAGQAINDQIQQAAAGEAGESPQQFTSNADVGIYVNITDAAGQTEQRQIRLQLQTGQNVADLQDEIEEILDQWERDSGNKDQVVTYEVGHVRYF